MLGSVPPSYLPRTTKAAVRGVVVRVLALTSKVPGSNLSTYKLSVCGMDVTSSTYSTSLFLIQYLPVLLGHGKGCKHLKRTTKANVL